MKATRGIRKYRKILDVATELFLEQGYQEASITKLLTRLGGSRETVYRHFRSKEDLFAAVIDHLLEDYLQFMLSLDIKGDDLRLGLLDWSSSLVQVTTSERYIQLRRVVIGEVGSRPEIGRLYFEHTFMKGTTAVSEFLARQRKLGKVKDIDPIEMTYYLIGMLLYRIMHTRVLNVTKQPARKQIRELTEKVVNDFITAFGTGI